MIDERVKKWIIRAMEDYKTIENEFKLSEEEIVPSAVCFHAYLEEAKEAFDIAKQVKDFIFKKLNITERDIL